MASRIVRNFFEKSHANQAASALNTKLRTKFYTILKT